MAARSRQEYLDDLGDRWVVEVGMDDGGLDLFVTAPGLEPRQLRPAHRTTPRPSVDAETPLPLENL